MARNNFLLVIVLLICQALPAESAYRYIVYLKDKPQQFDATLFTKKAIDKRMQHNIPFDERDYPVNTSYIDQLKNTNATVLYQSNWLNAALIQTEQQNIELIKQLPFVASVQWVGGGDVKRIRKSKLSGPQSTKGTQSCEETDACTDIEFEESFTSSYGQTHLLNGEYLHEQGFNGEEMIIAICDNGFNNANNNPGFSHIFSDNRILGTYDYVNGDSAVFGSNDGTHGSNCFSFIGGIKANQYIGTATKSKFYLFHTENDNSERLQEEFNLALALERCSQLGVDVVSISLGYTTFDVPAENHDTSILRTNSAPSTKAVNTAVSKGIIVLVAAGNEGTGSWKYISCPSDADSAIAVAAVDINGNVASFSGYGLPNDPRIKPNVAAVGVSATHLNTAGNVTSGNGTSYSCPALAGMVTCLWQAFPTKTNWEIKTAVEQSASKYLNPDKRVGYGIPDFKKAYQNLSTPTFVSNPHLENEYSIFPNPAENRIYISNTGHSQIQSIELMNTMGQVVFNRNFPSDNTIELDNLSKGMYLLQIATDQGILLKKIIKD